MLKKILLALMFVITAITSVTYAEDDMKTVASKAYVDTQIETKQLKIPAANQPNVGAGETVMTYTANGNGEIGERGLYSDTSSYNAATDGDKLITAAALNDTFTNLPTTDTTKLECANESDGCTLWTIVDQTAYRKSNNLFDKDNRERIKAYFTSSGGPWVYVGTGYSNRISCKPNTTYTARYNGNSTQAVLGFASTSSDELPTPNNPISAPNSIRQNSPTINTPITITTGPNDKWLIVAYNVAEPQNTDMANNLQIEEGPTATAYEPY